MSDAKVAFVGGEENTLCFRGMGFDVFLVNSLETLNDMLPALRRENYSIIFTEWRFYNRLKDQFEDNRSEALPVILGIPTRSSEKGRGSDFISQLVEMAVGSNIMLQGEE
ncbi:MAG: V-type ATP synthase subunit F [Atribacterota bacterium]